MARLDEDFEPDPELLAAFPDVSGNTVNGLGETAERRPSTFFWHPPERQTHGELRNLVVGKLNAARDGDWKWGDVGDRGPALVDVADNRTEKDAAAWADDVKAYSLAHEADLVGVAPLDPLWVYKGYDVAEPTIVVLGQAQNYEMMRHAPPGPGNHYSNTEVRRQYNRGARAATKLANYIRQQGYGAEPHFGPDAKALNMIPAALAAGFGELGKHGSIINRQLGSNFRLSAVSTDMPLKPDEQDMFGADDFCTNCNVCTSACPPDAIMKSKQTVRGTTKWYVDFDKCIPYFAERLGCALCMVVCPWSRPDVAPRLAEKMTRRVHRRSTTIPPAAT